MAEDPVKPVQPRCQRVISVREVALPRHDPAFAKGDLDASAVIINRLDLGAHDFLWWREIAETRYTTYERSTIPGRAAQVEATDVVVFARL